MDKIGKYELRERIGAGGFGVVYRAYDPVIGRQVAIKTLASEDEEMRQRFTREAQLAGRLNHPNITTIYDFGIEQGKLYLVQEFLSGTDLTAKLAEREAVPLSDRLSWMIDVAHGLAVAHDQGVVHRDIKPSNIRILDSGIAKVMDFGIAKLQNQRTQLTRTGLTIGTAWYLAPEQIDGAPLTNRSDIFSFGLVMYELLTHERAFDGRELWEVMRKILSEPHAPVTRHWPECPLALARIVEECLAKDPRDRISDCHRLAAELEEVDPGLAGRRRRRVTEPPGTSATSATAAWPEADPEPEPTAPTERRASPTERITEPTVSPTAPTLLTPATAPTRVTPAAGEASAVTDVRGALERQPTVRPPRPVEAMDLGSFDLREGTSDELELGEGSGASEVTLAAPARRGGLFAAGLLAVALAAAGGWWWFSGRAAREPRGAEPASVASEGSAAGSEAAVAAPAVAAPAVAAPAVSGTDSTQLAQAAARQAASSVAEEPVERATETATTPQENALAPMPAAAVRGEPEGQTQAPDAGSSLPAAARAPMPAAEVAEQPAVQPTEFSEAARASEASHPPAEGSPPGTSRDAGVAQSTAPAEAPAAIAPPAPPVASPVGTGTVRIERAWSNRMTVRVDDGPVQALDRDLPLSLAPGPHRLSFALVGSRYSDHREREIEVAAGESLAIRSPIPRPGLLRVQAAVGSPRAAVRVDGREVGSSPVEVWVAPGSPGITLVAGDRTRAAQAPVRSGELTVVTVDLRGTEPPKVVSRPLGADDPTWDEADEDGGFDVIVVE